MCGICGFTQADVKDLNTLKKMCDKMIHRGPDGEGYHVTNGVALGHRRLSLVDLESGDQPIVRLDGQKASETWTSRQDCVDKFGQYCIVMNGEVYNHADLRKELENKGWSFSTKSDTEVALVAYLEWGEKFLDHLRGMYAIAIQDNAKNELFCARDPFGIKPFFYTQQGKQFIFASEIKAIIEHPNVEKQVNRDALNNYLCFQFRILDETFFKGIYSLPQGHFAKVDADGNMKIERWWRPEFLVDRHGNSTASNKDELSNHEAVVEAINDALTDSVKYHNFADVEVGTLLSSGIDSSYNAALLSKINPDIKSFTVGFDEYIGSKDEFSGERNEIAWARELADKLGIENHSKTINEEEYWASLEKIAWFMDEPHGDPSAVALYFVDQLASKHVKGVLSGEGADELFGGYTIYQTSLSSSKLSWVPRPLLKGAASIMKKCKIRGWHYLDRCAKGVEGWYYTNAYASAFSVEEREKLLAGKNNLPLAHPSKKTAEVYARANADGLDDCAKMQYLDLHFWIMGDIFMKCDKMSMAHSLESRVPMLDKVVFDIARRLPTAEKISENQTKIALRDAAKKAIPADWAEKKKLGFPVPMKNWLAQDDHYSTVKKAFTSDAAEEYFNVDYLVSLLDDHKSGEADNSRKIWIVYMFLLWHRVYFEDVKLDL